eukprot:m.105272 g.105272  ORF g.105272 m.105272 type:complete len:191 (+) comp16862_c0_seq1:168-740(+)
MDDSNMMEVGEHSNSPDSPEVDLASPQKPAVRHGEWGDVSTTGRQRNRSAPKAAEDERFNLDAPSLDDDPDSDDDGAHIPSLDDSAHEELTAQVADAPSQQIQVATIADLDKDLLSSMPFTQTVSFHKDSGIDLKLLTNALNPIADIREIDEPWNATHLMTEIKSDLQSEKEEKAKEDDVADDLDTLVQL